MSDLEEIIMPASILRDMRRPDLGLNIDFSPFESIKKTTKKRKTKMNNVFLVNPSKKILAKLSEGGVETSNFSDGSDKGILIHTDESNVQKFLSEHLLKSEAIKVSDTDMDGIIKFAITKKKKNSPYTVQVKDNWYGHKLSEFKRAAQEILLPVLKKNIIMESVEHRQRNIPKDKENFHIILNSAPSGDHSQTAPLRVFGILTKCSSMFPTSKEGTPIKDWDTGAEIAEVVGNALYVHIILTKKSGAHRTAIFKTILEEFVLYFHTTEKKRQRVLKSRERERAKTAKAEYINLVGEQRAASIDNTKKDILKITKQVTSYQKELISLIRKGKLLNESLLSLETGKKDHLKSAQKEYKKILGSSKIKGISFVEGSLIIRTNMLYCEDPRTEIIHEIGEFNILIRVTPHEEGATNPDYLVLFYNMTRKIRVGGGMMQAPHVFADGRPCLGSLYDILVQQIADYQFSVVALLAIQFIENVNVDDSAGKNIHKWPVAKHSKIKVKDLSNEQRVTRGGTQMYPPIESSSGRAASASFTFGTTTVA